MIPEANYPNSEAVAYNDPYTAVLDPGQKVTAEWTPSQSGTTFFMPILAATKDNSYNTTYTVTADGGTIFGPDQAIPPTDIDDLSTVWWPPQEWDSTLEVTIKRLSSATGAKTYVIQPIGWEE